jgi:hypothetical protein
MCIAVVVFWNESPTEMQAAVKRSKRLMLILNCFASRNKKKSERFSQTTVHKGEEDDSAFRHNFE